MLVENSPNHSDLWITLKRPWPDPWIVVPPLHKSNPPQPTIFKARYGTRLNNSTPNLKTAMPP